MNRDVRGYLVTAALLVVAMPALGQSTTASPTASRDRALAATCAACHGTDGRAVQGETMVALAGYPKDALVASMKAFRDGSRPATVMHQIARGYNETQIEALASYFAAQSASAR